jgi:hypothetical protein
MRFWRKSKKMSARFMDAALETPIKHLRDLGASENEIIAALRRALGNIQYDGWVDKPKERE